MNLTLVRDVADTTATLGTLGAGNLTLQTIELPWVPVAGAPCGHPAISCVPAGLYQLALHDTPAHPKSFALVNATLNVFHEPGDVPAGVTLCRVACLIHVANYTSDLEGCIGVGLTRAGPSPRWMVVSSSVAYKRFQGAVPWISGHTLTISYASGVSP